MKLTRTEAFMLGFQFHQRLKSCYDSRDIGRMLTCEDFPPEIQALSNRMDGFRDKDGGTVEAMRLIRETLEVMDFGE